MKDTIGYCVKCKEKRTLKNAENAKMKNGRNCIKGKCSVCGTGVSIITKNTKD